MVERLSINFPMMRTYADPEGPFVRYSDYAAFERDLAMRPTSLTTLYEIRKAMGFNEYTSLDILARDCQSARRVLSDRPIPDDKSLLDLAEDVMRRLKETQAELLNYRQLYEAGMRPNSLSSE